ncbi:MAG: HAMP domain-containing protein, partial [Deltaproteobacteria bacterium]|nr:HAMP domain-containing protein [Deltaproteobacteria bacterium]
MGSLVGTGMPLIGFSWVFVALLWSFFTRHLEQELQARAVLLSEAASETWDGDTMSVPRLDPLVARWARHSDVRVTVIDVNGVIVAASSHAVLGKVANDTTQPGMLRALSGMSNGTVWQSPNFDYEDTMYANVPIVVAGGEILGAVRMAHSLTQIQDEVRDVRDAMLVTLVAYVAVLVAVMMWLGRTIARPVEALERHARDLALGDMTQRVPRIRGTIEVEALASTLNRMTERLERLEGLRRQYVSDVSHELRTPLASIRSITETLMAHGRTDPDLIERYLPRIVVQVDRLARLATQLLDLAQIESGNLIAHEARVELGNVVDEVFGVVAPAATERGVQLVRAFPKGLPAFRADRDRIVQVFLNLVDNAIRYTPRNGTVEVGARAEGRVL